MHIIFALLAAVLAAAAPAEVRPRGIVSPPRMARPLAPWASVRVATIAGSVALS